VVAWTAWDATSWDATSWDAASWDATSWDAAAYDAGAACRPVAPPRSTGDDDAAVSDARSTSQHARSTTVPTPTGSCGTGRNDATSASSRHDDASASSHGTHPMLQRGGEARSSQQPETAREPSAAQTSSSRKAGGVLKERVKELHSVSLAGGHAADGMWM
jgi:hypothetical protein